jgi:hypothetical protein
LLSAGMVAPGIERPAASCGFLTAAHAMSLTVGLIVPLVSGDLGG